MWISNTSSSSFTCDTVSNAFVRSNATKIVLEHGRFSFRPLLICSYKACRTVVVLLGLMQSRAMVCGEDISCTIVGMSSNSIILLSSSGFGALIHSL